MTRYTQDFFAYFGGKQVYKATGAYFTKEEGRAQAKQIYGQLAKTGSYGHLVVCVVSKYPTECWDGKAFGAQPPPPEPKAPVPVPKRFIPQSIPSLPKPTTVGPVAAILPGVPRPPQARVAGVQWVGDVRSSGRPSTQCPPGYVFSSRFHTCVPGKAKKGPVPGLGAVVTGSADVAEAKADLAVWGEKNPKASPAPGYKSDGGPWNATDASMLIAFATWWNTNYAVKLETTGVLDTFHLFSLRSYVLGSGGTSPYNAPGGYTSPGQPTGCPPGQYLVDGKCEPMPVAPGGGGAAPGGGGGGTAPVEDASSCAAKCTQVDPLQRAACLTVCTQKYGTIPTLPPGGDVTKPTAPAKSETPWGWIIAGTVLAGIAGFAIWSGARGVGAGMGEAGARDNPALRKYLVRFVHNVAPKDTDVMGPVDIPDGAFSNRNTLAKALRDVRVLPSGGRVRDFRVEGDKVIIFPVRSIWWSITLSPWTKAGGVREALGLDSVDRVHDNPTPSKNVYWRDIKSRDVVELRGHVYVVTSGRKKAVAFWEGREAREAQRFLAARAAIDQGGTLRIRDLGLQRRS